MVTHIREILPHHYGLGVKNLCYAIFVKETPRILRGQKTQNFDYFIRQCAHKWQHHCQTQRVFEYLKQRVLWGGLVYVRVNCDGGLMNTGHRRKKE